MQICEHSLELLNVSIDVSITGLNIDELDNQQRERDRI